MNIKNLSLLLNIFALVALREQLPFAIFIFCIVCYFLFLLKLKKHLFLTLFKLATICISCFLLWKTHRQLIATDFGISLVMLLSSLKLLELESVNDYFNMFLILITAEACLLINSPTSVVFIFSFIKIAIYFYFLLRIQNFKLGILNIKRIALLVAPAIVFSFILYFTFPRFTQGFNTPFSMDSFKTVNHNLDIKSLGELSLSDSKIFTIYGLPSEKSYLKGLYWKTNILWDFNQDRWRSGGSVLRLNSLALPLKSFQSLKIITEKNYFDYLPHMDTYSNVYVAGKKIRLFSDGTFKLAPPSVGRFEITQETGFKPVSLVLKVEREKGLRLNALNKDVNDLKIFSMIFNNKDLKTISTKERLYSVYKFFIDKKFEYSKTPQKYSSLQGFILTGHLGYCSHFASAYAYLLRLANIPSRVVLGYQGGEVNTFNDSIIVRERDSHAWVEYLNDEDVWIRIDPTEFVAPERISLGALLFFDKLNPYIDRFNLNIPKDWVRFRIFNIAEQLIDATSNKLNSSVFDFDLSDQKKIFKNKSSTFFVFTLIVFLTFYYFYTYIKILPSLTPEEKRFNKFLKLYAQKGYPKFFTETATEYGARLIILFPNDSEKIHHEVEAYINFFYRI